MTQAFAKQERASRSLGHRVSVKNSTLSLTINSHRNFGNVESQNVRRLSFLSETLVVSGSVESSHGRLSSFLAWWGREMQDCRRFWKRGVAKGSARLLPLLELFGRADCFTHLTGCCCSSISSAPTSVNPPPPAAPSSQPSPSLGGHKWPRNVWSEVTRNMRSQVTELP